MKKRIVTVLLLAVALSICACAKTEQPPTNAPTEVQTTTEAQEKRLTADEVTDLLKDKFDITKENCQYEVYSKGTSCTTYEDGTEEEGLGIVKHVVKKENGKLELRIEIEFLDSNYMKQNWDFVYKDDWKYALERNDGSYMKVPPENALAYLDDYDNILGDYESCEITEDGDNVIYTYYLEDKETGNEVKNTDGSILQSKETYSNRKEIIILDKNNNIIARDQIGVREGVYFGIKQTTEYETHFDFIAFDNVKIDMSDFSDHMYLATGEEKK